MKNSIHITLLILLFTTIPALAENVAKTDNIKHFGVSALLGYAFGYGIEKYTQNNNQKSDLLKVTVSTSLALSIGIAKEIYDSNQPDNHFSKADLAADFTGSLLGALLSNYIHRTDKDFTFLVTPTKPTQISLSYHF